MRLRQPDQRPRPRHDPVRVVAAAAGGQPATAGVLVRDPVEQGRGRAIGTRRQAQVRKRIVHVRVAAVLGDEERRLERSGERGQHPLDGREPRTVAGQRLERHVDLRAERRGTATLLDEAGSREKRHARLVDRERQHLRIVPEERLGSVAVMHVEVDVEHAMAGVARSGDGQRDVVVDAEAGRASGHRVVQAAARIEGMLDLAGQDPIDGVDRAAGDRRRRLVHAVEWRTVARADPVGRRAPRIVRELADCFDVVPAVQSSQLVVRRHPRLDETVGADGAHQVDRRRETAWRQRMLGAEVVAQVHVAEDDQRLHCVGHAGAFCQPVSETASCHASAAPRPLSSSAA